jgi:endoglucanase
MKPLLQTLTEIASPSGHEDELRALVQKTVKPYADETRVDALGNLIVRKGHATSKGKRVLLAAHLDEIGLIVSHVDAHGFARFSALGGFHPHRLVGTRVKFLNGVRGVIGLHQSAEERDRQPGLDKFFVDTGAASDKDCKVKVGDKAVFDVNFLETGNRLVSKAFDDRVGAALLIETLHTLKTSPHEIYFVFTVQEEIGVRGAGPAAYGIEPEIALALDVTPANDQPGSTQRNAIALGHGPAIKIKDNPMLADPALVETLTRLAKRNNIPHQLEVNESISSDVRAMQIVRAGARVSGISIPIRNLHSPSEMIDFADVKNAAKLLNAFLRATDV